MTTSTVFTNNRTQAVRLPADTRFPANIKKVEVRVLGNDRIISPVGNSWDSFFFDSETVSDDFMDARPNQEQSPRGSLE